MKDNGFTVMVDRGKRFRTLGLLLVLTVLLSSCRKEDGPMTNVKGVPIVKITVTSPAFADGSPIPSKYTVDGPGVSPPLEWGDVPKETKSIAVLVDDPDAPIGVFTHWTLFALPPDTRSLSENVPHDAVLKSGGRQGKNDGGKIGYYPPAPPIGTHRYRFKVYALDSEPNLKSGASVEEFKKAVERHVLGEGELVGTYKRK